MELRHKDFDQAKYDAVKQVYAEFQRELYLSVWGICQSGVLVRLSRLKARLFLIYRQKNAANKK